MAKAALEHPWFQQHMPNYSYGTASNDWKQIIEEFKLYRRDLGAVYVNRHVDEINTQIQEIKQTIEQLQEIKKRLEKDLGNNNLNKILNIVDAISRQRVQLDKFLASQRKILPIEEPVKVQNNIGISFGIDQLLASQASLPPTRNAGLLDDGIIEGDYE